MKSTLTSADPKGWYGVCRPFQKKTTDVGYWNGKKLLTTILQPVVITGRMYTESDVAELNEELRTLREELATNKHSLDVCSKYAESMKRSSEDYLNELRKARDENATLQSQADSLLKQAEQLEAELSRLKSQPYEMRRAERPDCAGLWRNAHGDICNVKSEKDICLFGEAPPYYLLGPIPVVVAQQPPKVVKVREKETGVTADAIVGNIAGMYTLLSLDGKACSVVSGDQWKEVQS